MVFSGFIFGLLSSLHCVGMCGPIAMMLPIDRSDPRKKAAQLLTYHAGRLTAYGSIGLLFGALGRGLYLAGIQQQFSVALGIMMLLAVLIPEQTLARYNFSRPVTQMISRVKSAMGAQFKKRSFRSFYTIGLLNGFLPCGMVYVALFGAMAMQSIPLGLGFMLLFGLGTVPLMTGIAYVSQWFTPSLRTRIQKLIPYTVSVLALLFILRGLGLGIPYVSPSDVSLFVQAAPQCR